MSKIKIFKVHRPFLFLDFSPTHFSQVCNHERLNQRRDQYPHLNPEDSDLYISGQLMGRLLQKFHSVQSVCLKHNLRGH